MALGCKWVLEVGAKRKTSKGYYIMIMGLQ